MTLLPPMPSGAVALMIQETKMRLGHVPCRFNGVDVREGETLLTPDAFMLHHAHFACLYERGKGVRAQLFASGGQDTLELFLAGSVHAAIASLNGLLPLHASAVMIGGQAIAFAGPSGAGKSTLAAALAMRGMPLVCDDTLVIDPASADWQCLPGHKRLKLWPEGLDLAGARDAGVVSQTYPKRYADLEHSTIAAPVPLRAIAWISQGPDFTFDAITGSDKLRMLQDDHYTTCYRDYSGSRAPEEYFTTLTRFARDIPMFHFVRPTDPAIFDATCDRLIAVLEKIDENQGEK